MNITFHGQTCFKIVSQRSKADPVTILIDPIDKESGLKPIKSEADILIETNPEKDNSGGEKTFFINGAGEYDVSGAFISGVEASGKNGRNIVYVIDTEEVRVCHLGNLESPDLTSDQLEEIGDVDILLVPIGGGSGLNTKQAIKIMGEIEPKITIPMRYKVPGLKEDLDGLDDFLKEFGIKELEKLPKLSIKKKELPTDEAKIIILEN